MKTRHLKYNNFHRNTETTYLTIILAALFLVCKYGSEPNSTTIRVTDTFNLFLAGIYSNVYQFIFTLLTVTPHSITASSRLIFNP